LTHGHSVAPPSINQSDLFVTYRSRKVERFRDPPDPPPRFSRIS
jgi:hypothetical protein